jgi:hypothetical protein
MFSQAIPLVASSGVPMSYNPSLATMAAANYEQSPGGAISVVGPAGTVIVSELPSASTATSVPSSSMASWSGPATSAQTMMTTPYGMQRVDRYPMAMLSQAAQPQHAHASQPHSSATQPMQYIWAASAPPGMMPPSMTSAMSLAHPASTAMHPPTTAHQSATTAATTAATVTPATTTTTTSNAQSVSSLVCAPNPTQPSLSKLPSDQSERGRHKQHRGPRHQQPAHSNLVQLAPTLAPQPTPPVSRIMTSTELDFVSWSVVCVCMCVCACVHVCMYIYFCVCVRVCVPLCSFEFLPSSLDDSRGVRRLSVHYEFARNESVPAE